MRSASAFLVVALFLVSACSRREDAGGAGSAQPTAEETAAAPASEPGDLPLPAGNAGFDYVCGDGLAFHARIDSGNAVVTVDGKTLTLAPVPGALGANYAGDGAEFIARGDEARFMRPGGAMQLCKAK